MSQSGDESGVRRGPHTKSPSILGSYVQSWVGITTEFGFKIKNGGLEDTELRAEDPN